METRLKEVKQGRETSTELLKWEAETSTLKGKQREVEEAREKQEEEITQAEPRNGKMQTLTDHRGSPTRNLCYRGFLVLEASSSLLCSEKLLCPRLIETDGILKGSPRQAPSSHKASPPRSFIPEVPTSAETRGKAQE